MDETKDLLTYIKNNKDNLRLRLKRKQFTKQCLILFSYFVFTIGFVLYIETLIKG